MKFFFQFVQLFFLEVLEDFLYFENFRGYLKLYCQLQDVVKMKYESGKVQRGVYLWDNLLFFYIKGVEDGGNGIDLEVGQI